MGSSGGQPLYVNISRIDLNIDGEKSSYITKIGTKMNNSGLVGVGASTTIYTNSENIVAIPAAVFARMIEAKDCRIRIETSNGLVDATFSIERSDSAQAAALYFMRPFLAKIREHGAKT